MSANALCCMLALCACRESQPLPQSLAQPLPQSLAQPLPQSLAQPLPQSLAQPLPQSLAQPLPQSLAQPLSEMPAQLSRPREQGGSLYLGQASCAACHVEQAEKWAKSDHARSMQTPDERSVLGDFEDAELGAGATQTSFFKRDRRYFVRTAGADGVMHDYPIAYTFGAYPLQQYLIALPRGRMQALTIAWDARPKAQGGQRWFDLYEGQAIQPGDSLHWTGRDQNWNFMCASCHSTQLERNYDLANDAYETTWSELNVSCEACHGPGAKHVAWARAGADESLADRGLTRTFDATRAGAWALTAAEPIARWMGPARKGGEVEACAPCHARAMPLTDNVDASRPFLDSYLPAGLDDPQYYHPDGQTLGEVFEYGSFVQSKMHHAGVTCSDCHDPHSAQLRRPQGNNTCTQCHRPTTFDTQEHHHHATGNAAVSCVDCHMPERTFMQVDARRDHSFRVPRPELTNAPNTCANCHANEPESFVREAMTRWYGDKRRAPSHANAIAAGRSDADHAAPQLNALANDPTHSAFIRAGALTLLSKADDTAALAASLLNGTIRRAANDPDGLVRVAAARALHLLPPLEAAAVGSMLTADTLRAVRVEAARELLDMPRQFSSPAGLTQLDAAVAQLIAAELASAERPEAHLNLSNLHLRMAQPEQARAALQNALRLDPRFVPALIALAELERAQGRDAASVQLLDRALALAPGDAAAHYARGLAHARNGETAPACEQLAAAARLQPQAAGYAHTYALALIEAGEHKTAEAVLTTALTR